MTNNIPELPFIKDPELVDLLKTIKQFQARLKQFQGTYAQACETMEKEFPDFASKYNSIFVMLIRGDKYDTLGKVLYYRSKVLNGEMEESELASILAEKYIPSDINNPDHTQTLADK